MKIMDILAVIACVAISLGMGAAHTERATVTNFSTNCVDRFITDLGDGVSVVNYGHATGDNETSGIVLLFQRQKMRFARQNNMVRAWGPGVTVLQNESGKILDTTDCPILIARDYRDFFYPSSKPIVLNLTIIKNDMGINATLDGTGINLIQMGKSGSVQVKGGSNDEKIFIYGEHFDLTTKYLFLKSVVGIPII